MRKPILSLLFIFSSGFFFSQIGIHTPQPTESVDVATGNVRIRDINTNTSNDSSDKLVVTDPNGVLKVNNSLFIPSTSVVGNKTTATSNIAANFDATVTFNTNALLNNFTYNSATGEYTALKSGYHQITITVNKDVSMNNPTGGTSVVNLLVNNSVKNSTAGGYLDGTHTINQNFTYVTYLNPGDTFKFTSYFTRTHSVTSAQVSVIALGG
ncbi:hypothetical protein ACMGDK_05140 [Chryseobacterium sp. DT-3]|uniref:hypothetical protein n=1 Tax=Chryseobacterium sp. DT-3 TaxID=3396164 RepID=UPI003F1C922D